MSRWILLAAVLLAGCGDGSRFATEPTGWVSEWISVDAGNGYIVEIRKDGKLVARFFDDTTAGMLLPLPLDEEVGR